MDYKEFDINEVTQQQFNEAELTLIDYIRSVRPDADLRVGTALRDLLIRLSALIFSLDSGRIEAQRASFSLLQAVDNPDTFSDAELDYLLANLAISREQGAYAVGTVLMRVSDSRQYPMANSYQFESPGGTIYQTQQLWTAVPSVTDSFTQLQLYTDTNGTYFFLLPVISATEEVSTVQRGDVMIVQESLFPGYISSTAYADFSGGRSKETNEEILARTPEILSYRGMDSAAAISTKLFNAFSFIESVSVIGRGNEAMLRDKHNVLGFSVGSTVDVYCRTSVNPYTVTLTKTGTKLEDGVYRFVLTVEDAPGAYSVRTVTKQSTPDAAVGSYPVSTYRIPSGTGNTYHDFDTSQNNVEIAYTRWQAMEVVVNQVESEIVDGAATWPDTLDFRVEVYTPTQVDSVQEFIDSDAERSQNADHVIRGIVPCFVSIRADVYVTSDSAFDLDTVKEDIVEYINTLRPGVILAASAITAIIQNAGASQVVLDDSGEAGLRLDGTIPAADDTELTLSGNTLDISHVDDPTALVTQETIAYMCDIRDIFLNKKVV